ncbi:MAG: CDP-diacylglycerol--glycerol-3-phosphate 3-phosphatidyltransferase [Turicibacter sp.]|nr:CDP-diacylglycerol--glycerol-3-phosphate 3-phosphatidyltransferase [Turicibacter sp.]
MRINTPNVLVLLRVAVIPVYLFLYLNEDIVRLVPLVIFLVASISDFFDGYLARKWNMVSNFGKLMDPLADKMLVSAALVALAYTQNLDAWIVVVFICREFWVTSLRMLALEQRREVKGASIWGKIKTTLQMTMISVLISGIFTDSLLELVLIYLSVAAAIFSAVQYTRDYKDVLIEL